MQNNVDLLLVTPPGRAEVYQQLSNEYAAIEPPVWSGLIAQFVRSSGHSVQILDAEAECLTHKQTAERVLEVNAALTVFVIYGQQPSASTQCMPGARRVAEMVRAASYEPTLVMGTHASALPRRTILEEPYSYVCEGEGPHTVLHLLKVLKAGDLSRLGDVPGLWYRENGEVQRTPPAPKIRDLDAELPRQAWDLLDMTRYRAHNWHCFDNLASRNRYASLQTSLGCPYRCTFCCINAPFGGSGIRYWSAAAVLRQVDELVNTYGVRNIKIPDEMFVLNKAHVLEICDGLIERGYDLNIWAYARIDTIRDEFLEKLKKAGFNWLGIGIESGSRHVRDGVEKGRFGEREIVATVRKTRDHGIHVGANYIFGLPDDTLETMRETLDLALYLNTEWANFYCAMAYPGSPLYTLAQERGWPTPEIEGGPGWIGYSQHAYDTMPLPTEALSCEAVLDFRDSAFQEYFTNPAYLSMIRSTFGAEAEDHVSKMTRYTLPRRHREQNRIA